MRITILLLFLIFSLSSFGQKNNKYSTMDFVQVLDNNKEEALFYYQNNWMVLRKMAIKKNYIHSFQLLESPSSENEPFQFILITTYPNKEMYDKMEDNFAELMEERGPLKLLNKKQPKEFRKVLFYKDMVRHWN